MDRPTNRLRYVPLAVVIGVLAGILMTSIYNRHLAGYTLGIINASTDKLSALLGVIEQQYVDSVDVGELVEKAMPQILGELDPHSVYIPAQNLEAVNSELEGSFSGIGIQFTIQQDTIHINQVVPGGPSEKVGLMAGDRVVTVDDSLFVGKTLNNDKALRTLKGPRGTHVKLGIKRATEKDLLFFDIVRGDIPQHTIDAAYMLPGNFGYILLNKFGRTSHAELLNAIAQLKHQGYKGLIIDLRGNSGGYMEAAVRMVNEFLPHGQLIVYAQGLHYPRTEEYANGMGSCQDIPLVVLTDESSASSSEIFAGAIQDNDRGTIVGLRSFGKGLVQQPIDFSDGSAIRLTIARYYTPSGRCIQRPYKGGKDSDYEMDWINRYEHGEYFHADSIKLDPTQRFTTLLGRPVYGGGGIMPDIFVPQDTVGVSTYLIDLRKKNLIVQFSFNYADANRSVLNSMEDEVQMADYLKKNNIVEQLIRYAEKKGVKRRNILIHKSYEVIERNVIANIIYNIMGQEPYVKYINQDDATVKRALQVLREEKAFPVPPASKKHTE
ncbi:MAG: S41 family peptidase [Prevotellaceae bacterium]|jgi:carboxyl-terminal processing protease|nr:S41 family peptidase [Prevotellaceae bacterium]